jgi:hypothetical protein
MVPSPAMSPRRTPLHRLFVVLALTLGLVAGACSSDAQPNAEPVATTEAPTTTSTTADRNEVVVATAKNAELEVIAEPPAGVEPTTSTSTTVADRPLPAIPRPDLNSAGSRKTDGGWAFENPTYFGNPLVVVVTEDAGDWLRVMIPARPNGLEGWVAADQVELSTTTYRMELNLTDFHLTVYDGDTVVEETDVVIGKDATYTPTGRFYLNEKIEQSNPGGVYGPWVLSTNGYSESLDTFDGGLPVVAFHGTNQPELIGTQASNGCIRMPNDVVIRLAEMLPAGTPIDIVA